MAGYTYRVGAMLDVFNDMSKCKYRRNGLSSGKIHKTLPKLHYNKDGQLMIRGKKNNDNKTHNGSLNQCVITITIAVYI